MNIAIIGLGLIGGSFCRAIKKHTSHTVLGLDIDAEVVRRALREGAVDREITAQGLLNADLTIVCLYPEVAESFILSHIGDFAKGSIVIDTCGIKQPIVTAVEEPLHNAGVRYVGCHPMAGREFSGFSYSMDSLFDGASFLITKTEQTDNSAADTVAQLALAIGFGQTVVTTPEDHDRVIAFTSQLAHIVSSAYMKSPTAKREKGFSAGSYQDLTRVARLNEDMWTPLFMQNREPLLNEIDEIVTHLMEYKTALENKDDLTLKKLLREGRLLKEQDLAQNI